MDYATPSLAETQQRQDELLADIRLTSHALNEQWKAAAMWTGFAFTATVINAVLFKRNLRKARIIR